MRWFKHMCRAHKDPKLVALIEKGDYEAYGLYWRLVEEIGDALETKGNHPGLTHTEIGWAQILQISLRKFRRILYSLAGCNLIERRINDGSSPVQIEIVVCKMLKYRDEYQKKSGVSPESLRTMSDSKNTDNRYRDITDSVDSTELEDFQAVENNPPSPLRRGRVQNSPLSPMVFPEHWATLLHVAGQAGMTYAEGELKRLAKTWDRIGIAERMIAIEDIPKRQQAGEYADPAYVPSLRRYLEDKRWTAPSRPPPKRSGTVSEIRKQSAEREFDRRILEVMKGNA